MSKEQDRRNETGASAAQSDGGAEDRFSHPSEQEFARILDFYEIPWEYEPRTFALERDEEGHIKEAFSPDFYLPDQDLYIELTTLKPKLMNRKNRKLRLLQELYPDVQVKLVNRKDFANLLFKYGLEDEEEQLVGQSAIDNEEERDGSDDAGS
jgi:hypothetical protein